MKVLLSAYSCTPNLGSEPGVGWNWARQIAKNNEVWVITRETNRKSIESAEKPKSLHFVYVDSRLPGLNKTKIYYIIWQAKAYLKTKKLHKMINFDLCHHITFCSYWMPSFMAFLNIPFVFGPVGGGELCPKQFFKDFGLRARIHEYLRDLTRKINDYNPFARDVARKTKASLASNRETAARLKSLGHSNVNIMSQLMVDFSRPMPAKKEKRFRIASIGRLLHWKGFYLGVMAFAKLLRNYPESEYWIIGDGPERRRLEKLAKNMGISSKVVFFGKITREEVIKKLGNCDVLLHPSLRESGGMVCLEAMALGLPVVCFDIGGPDLLVSSKCGIKVNAKTPCQSVDDLAKAMARLANPKLRNQMGKSAYKRALCSFSCKAAGKSIGQIYNKAIK